MLTKCSNVERFVPFKRVDRVKGNLYITPENLMRSLSTFITLLDSALSKSPIEMVISKDYILKLIKQYLKSSRKGFNYRDFQFSLGSQQ